MRRPHIRSLAVAVAVTTAATSLAGTAFATPATGTEHATATAASATSVVSAARAAALAHSSATGVSQGDELRAEDVMIDPEGARHVRFTRTHQGLPVLGGDLVVHLTGKLAYAGVTRAADHTVRPAATSAKLSADQAEQKAATAAKGEAGAAELVVDARDGGSALAYRIRVDGSSVTEGSGSSTVVIDAVTGTVRSNTPDSDAFLSPELVDTLRERGEKLEPAADLGSRSAGTPASPGRRPQPATRRPPTARASPSSSGRYR